MIGEKAMAHPIRVLIVDDSAFARWTIAGRLGGAPGIEVAGFATNGNEALEKIAAIRPDVVTLDVQMPRMDGLAALKRIMDEHPTPVVMVSSLTGDDALPTIEALELGAVDFFLKPNAANPAGRDRDSNELADKIRHAAIARLTRAPHYAGSSSARPRIRRNEGARKVVVIGSSIGGPRALCRLIPSLPGDIPAAILIVQHMPAGFTRSLADRLNQLSQIEVKEAAEGDLLQAGKALLAPGGYHMEVSSAGQVRLNQDKQVCGVRPSVDVTMESAARAYGGDAISVVLTGMGMDGTAGAGRIRQAGGQVLVEDESTCTVFGMPKSVIDKVGADAVYPIDQMAGGIMESVSRGRRMPACAATVDCAR